MESHIKEHPANFHRFSVLWTPTVLIMDPEGFERMRSEGYLPKAEFRAWLLMSLARLSFVRKDWDAAAAGYGQVAESYPTTAAAPESIYWKGVCRYKKGDHSALGDTAIALAKRYPDSLWASKASVWSP